MPFAKGAKGAKVTQQRMKKFKITLVEVFLLPR
jgi:hypothetical protein